MSDTPEIPGPSDSTPTEGQVPGKRPPAVGGRAARRRDLVPAGPRDVAGEREAPAERRPGGRTRVDPRLLRHAQFHPSLLAIDERPKSPIHKWVLLVIGVLILTALLWSVIGRFASYTQAPGKIQASGRTKVVEALAAGRVIKINKTDGDSVKAGDILIELDPTFAAASRAIIDNKLTNTRAESLRLKTEIIAARAPTVDPDTLIGWGPDVPAAIRTRESAVARADLTKLRAAIDTLLSKKAEKEVEVKKYARSLEAQKALVAVTQENLTMIEELTKNGYNSQATYLDAKAKLDTQQVTQTSLEGALANAKQAILVIESEIAKTREAFVTASTQKVATDEQSIVDLAQQLIKADQLLTSMTLRAPVDGTIHASGVTTIGQVVKAGQQLLQIVPTDAPLEIVAYVSNTDIGFIRKGDPALIKVTAFNYATYGGIDGRVVDVANESQALIGKPTVQSSSLDGEFRPTTQAQKTGNLQFLVTIQTKRKTMTVEGREMPLVPGMQVNVEILTEYRQAIDYILAPIEELFSTAGHERT